MQEELIKLIPDLKKVLETGVAYTSDLFNRAVMFYKIETIMWIIFNLIFIALVPLFIKWIITGKTESEMYDKEKEEYLKKHKTTEEWIIARVIFAVVGLVIALMCVIGLLFNITNLIQLYTIPEVFIMQVITQPV